MQLDRSIVDRPRSLEDVGPGARYRYRLDGAAELADPCSRSQPDGVHGLYEVVDLGRFAWSDDGFVPAQLARTVIYELHVGTFSEEGTFEGAISALDHLVALGVTAVEVMPVAQFAGRRNWGYGGVFLFAVQDSYGGPAGLQPFVDACHGHGLAVVVDVVHNHFGPEGNVLKAFGPYTTDRYSTPWGPAVNVEQADSDEVRRFFIESALAYFTDFHVDALRLDAVHGIVVRSAHPFLAELAEATARLAAESGRPLRPIAESSDNDPRLVASPSAGGYGLDAQWCDDFHHSLRVLLTGERDGYYADYGRPDQLARAMVEGFSFQGEYSWFRRRRHGARPTADGRHRFVVCTQNQDQIGNRGAGDRPASMLDVARLRLAAAVLLLSPTVPLLFMGEEYGEVAPFPCFVDHSDPELLAEVHAGRAAEFGTPGDLLDPAAERTFQAARPNRAMAQHSHQPAIFALYRGLIAIRAGEPLVTDLAVTACEAHAVGALVLLCRRGRQGALISVFNTGPETEYCRLPENGDGCWSRLVDGGAEELGGDGALFPIQLEPGAPLVLPPFGFVSYLSAERNLIGASLAG